MNMDVPKAEDLRLRRLARRKGYALRRSFAPLSHDNYGGYRIVAPGNWIAAGEKFDLDPEAVERWLVAAAPWLRDRDDGSRTSFIIR
jgi:hypothetical protein